MNQDEANLNAFSNELAGRLKAASVILNKFSTPAAARSLIDALISGDRKAFRELIGPIRGVDMPPLGKCFWVSQIIEAVTSGVSKGPNKKCYLRTDLTSAERAQYLLIALRHRASFPLDRVRLAIREAGGPGPEVPEGAFRDQLEAAGLLKCELYPMIRTEHGSSPLLTKPERICI
jgi:hypothetical protein